MATTLQPRLARTDSRGRMTLGRPDEAFLVSEQADGAIILEPAVTLPALQAKLLANADLQERLTRAHQGTGLVRRTGRRVPKA